MTYDPKVLAEIFEEPAEFVYALAENHQTMCLAADQPQDVDDSLKAR